MKIISTKDPEFNPDWLKCLELDPVHPTRPVNDRVEGDREVFFLISDLMTPILVLCVAFGDQIYDKVQKIFNHEIIPRESYKAATFYSVFKTPAKDEVAISAGEFLRDAAVMIKNIYPTITEFMTLSPIPSLSENNVPTDEDKIIEYLRDLKDPVAKFHLRNGAVPYQIRFDADESETRQKESAGIMVNYDYSGVLTKLLS